VTNVPVDAMNQKEVSGELSVVLCVGESKTTENERNYYLPNNNSNKFLKCQKKKVKLFAINRVCFFSPFSSSTRSLVFLARKFS
jgi:hypothetical protein